MPALVSNEESDDIFCDQKRRRIVDGGHFVEHANPLPEQSGAARPLPFLSCFRPMRDPDKGTMPRRGQLSAVCAIDSLDIALKEFVSRVIGLVHGSLFGALIICPNRSELGLQLKAHEPAAVNSRQVKTSPLRDFLSARHGA